MARPPRRIPPHVLRHFDDPEAALVLADVLPILGNIVEIGNGLVAGIVALVCSLVTIAIAWIFYRPVLAIFLLILAAGGIYLLWKKRQAKKAAVAPAAPATPSAAF